MATSDQLIEGTEAKAPPWERLLLVFMMIGAVYLLLNLLHMPFGRDQAIFAVIADTAAQGGAMYRDAWDIKPPGIFLLYMLGHALFGATEVGIRLFEILSMSVFGVLTVYATRRSLPVAASVICFTIATHNLLLGGFWNTAQTESFAAVFLLAGILLGLTTATGTAKRLLIWGLCSACFAFAGLLKPTLAAGAVVSFLAVAAGQYRHLGLSGVLAPFLTFLVGAAAVVGPVLLYLWVSGGLDAFLETMLVFAPQYTQLGLDRDLADIVTRTLFGFFGSWLFILPGIVLLFLLGRNNSQLMRDGAHFAIQIAVLLFGVALQGKFYPYHFMAPALVAAVPAGWGFWLLLRKFQDYRFGLVGFCVIFAILMVGNYKGRLLWKDNIGRIQALLSSPEDRFAIETAMYKVHTVDTAANRLAADWLRQNSPTEGADLLVFGFEPVIYRYSGLPHFTRYIFNVPFKAPWSRQVAEDELYAALSDPPWAIVVQSSDRLPQMSGDRRDSRTFIEEEMPEFAARLEADYTKATVIGPHDIYVLKNSD